MNEEIKTTAANGKLSTIFLVVLGLHVAVIVAFIAYNLLRGNTPSEAEVAEVPEMEQPAAVAEETVMPAQLEPTLETAEVPTLAESNEVEMGGQMTMPAPNDPIYSNTGKVQPRAAEQSQVAPMVTEVVKTNAATMAAGSYTVKKGDSLAKIARIHGTTVAELRSLNGISGDMIKIGQTLNVPGAGAGLASGSSTAVQIPSATVVKAPAVVKTGFSEYTVAAGDTLWKIAKSFNTEPSTIAKINGITDPSKLKVGSTIKVPTSASQEAAVPKAEPVRTEVQKRTWP
ncbi:MAG: LysM peptidoglycan-binding domain-containing protein [Blastochloris sp.]|nr:LysM peptidoglycan-binding domain-containing protein [Blastochloris sp.]